MGSSDSTEFPPIVPLLFGDEVDLSELSGAEAVALLRGFFQRLQPCHKYLPAKPISQMTEWVRPLRDRVPSTPSHHVFYEPVKLLGVNKREKCVDLQIHMGWVKWALREAHSESHHALLWTNTGKLVVTSSYHSNDVGGTVAMDFVAATDEQLQRVFTNMDYMTGKLWMRIVTSTLEIVEKMLAERQALVDSQRKLFEAASTLRNQFSVPPEPPRRSRW